MSFSSDDYGPNFFTTFTAEDYQQIDAKVDCLLASPTPRRATPDFPDLSFSSEIDGLNLKHLTSEEWDEVDQATARADADIEDLSGHVFHGEPNAHLHYPNTSEEASATLNTVPRESDSRQVSPAKVDIALEAPSDEDVREPKSPGADETAGNSDLSPKDQFRANGVFSVSDFVSPSWCEVQYEYGLRGKRSRPLTSRPTSFTSTSGKVIRVEQPVSHQNDVRTKQGQAIHKEFEREIRAQELQVDLTTKETRWALRLVNLISCMKELLHTGLHLTREMPVFGIVQDEVVVGIIDEVRSELQARTSRKRTMALSRRHTVPNKKRISSSMKVSPTVPVSDPQDAQSSESNDTERPPRRHHTFYLVDAKTRRQNSVPNDVDSRGGQLQLNIYRKLLCDLLDVKHPAEFRPLWEKLTIDCSAQLPTKFLVQAQVIKESDDSKTVSVDDLAQAWCNLVNEVDISVNLLLELRYYMRPPDDYKGKGKSVPEQCVQSRTIRKALSLPTSAGPSNWQRASKEGDEEDIALQWALQESLATHPSELGHDASVLDRVNVDTRSTMLIEKQGIRRFPLVGKKQFFSDQVEMNKHISDTLRWWKGERKPRGVPIELTSRCRTCEYSMDCEWRSEKAKEMSRTRT